MTFVEFCKQVSRETGYPQQLTQDIMLEGIRVFLEEMMANKEHAILKIKGLFDIYLIKKHCKMYMSVKGRVEEFDRWVLKIKPSKKFKALVNEEMNPHDYLIGGKMPLYPEEYYKTHERKGVKKARDKALEQVPILYKMQDANRKKRMKLRKKMKKNSMVDKLPQED